MREYLLYRESDHKYVTATLMRSRNTWEWGERENAVVFTGSTLPVLRDDEQVEELPHK